MGFEHVVPRSRVKHSITEPLCSLVCTTTTAAILGVWVPGGGGGGGGTLIFSHIRRLGPFSGVQNVKF